MNIYLEIFLIIAFLAWCWFVVIPMSGDINSPSGCGDPMDMAKFYYLKSKIKEKKNEN